MNEYTYKQREHERRDYEQSIKKCLAGIAEKKRRLRSLNKNPADFCALYPYA